MENVTSYILALILASLISFLADSLLKEGGIKQAARFGVSLALVLLMVLPLQKLLGGLSAPAAAQESGYNARSAAQVQQGIGAMVRLQKRFEGAEVFVAADNDMKVKEIVIRRAAAPPLAEQGEDGDIKENLKNVLAALYGINKEGIRFEEG